MRRLGVFGGTFDPPHRGHVTLAVAATEQLGLEQVLWLVAADPPHKQGQKHTPASIRAEMVAALVADLAGQTLSRIDLDRPGPHFTVDALRLLRQQAPTDELYFLIGGDSLRDFPTWRSPKEIIALSFLAVLERPGAEFDLADLEVQVPGIRQRVCRVDVPPITISSRSIRAAVRAGRVDEVAADAPDPVGAIIRSYNLYRV